MAALEPAAAVAVPTAGPSRNNEDPQPSLYLTTSIEIFMQDQSPAHALCSLLAMCWFWSSSSEAEEEDLNLGSALLSLGRLVKDKLACLADNVSACLSCQRGSKQASVDAVCTIYNSYQEGSAAGGVMDDSKETQGGESGSGPAREGVLLRPCPKHMSVTERLRKVIQELVDTEKSYVKTLEERIPSKPDLSTLETPSQFKWLDLERLVERKSIEAFKEFLDAKNPTKQHSSTLESYLIKPVQRVLKYPLLLRELVSLTDADSEEHYHLTEALKAMEKVASHINEMQKIYEDFGSVFDQLVAEQTGHDKEVDLHFKTRSVTEISMGEFLMHSSVVWLNPHPSLGRMRKDPEMTVFGESRNVVPENKVNIIKVIRSILRENIRKNMRSEGTLERGCKEHLVPLHKTASWLCKQPLEVSFQAGNPKLGPDSDDGSLSSGTYSFSGAPPVCTSSDAQSSTVPQNWSQAQKSDSQPRSTSVKESDILSDEDDDGFSEGGTRRDSGDSSSPASAIEAQFLHLKLSEDAVSKCILAPCVQPEGIGDTPEIKHKLVQRQSGVRRKNYSLRKNQGALLHMKQQNRPLDGQTDPASPCDVVDLNMLLEREFSVQSLTSVVNEDCFFDRAESCATDSGNTMST
ncbi:hypothetical protein XENOCAPTIV_017806 [Xenoophorus captivus]|uniref:DH domain-containing protein n=1 Tax=Xenoophorus captivus TaxID=1517983 RepID=A0ABV0RUI8_9TELE